MSRKKINILLIVLGVLCLLLVAGSLIYMLMSDKEHKELEVVNVELSKDAVKQIEVDPTTAPAGDKNMLMNIDWEYLKRVNEDIIGWIYIPDTNINYPILQEQKEGVNYYLDHDYRKEKNKNGAIFTQKLPLGSNDPHLILFGHHRSGQDFMFSRLEEYYKDEAEAKKHFYCYIFMYDDATKKSTAQRWKVWTTANVTNYDMAFETPFSKGTDEYQALIEHMADTSNYIISLAPTRDENILMLATCDKRSGIHRFYVSFVLDFEA